jgi:peptidoglycan/LPS O-acetylase OafA/YrhL
MTSDLDSGGESPIELRRRRIFRVRLWIGTGGYLLASFALYQWGQGTSPWRIIWAVLPLLFFAWNVIVIVLRMHQLDEYQIKLLFPPLAVGFTVAMFAAITLGTLNAAGFAVPHAGWPVALIGMVTWGCTTLATRAPKA